MPQSGSFVICGSTNAGCRCNTSSHSLIARLGRNSGFGMRSANLSLSLSLQIPIALSHSAMCRPIAYSGTASGGAAFREVFDVAPFLNDIMNAHTGKNLQIRMVLKFVYLVPIRQFAHVPSYPYWMNVLGEYEIPSRCALPMANLFSPWGFKGRCVCILSRIRLL